MTLILTRSQRFEGRDCHWARSVDGWATASRSTTPSSRGPSHKPWSDGPRFPGNFGPFLISWCPRTKEVVCAAVGSTDDPRDLRLSESLRSTCLDPESHQCQGPARAQLATHELRRPFLLIRLHWDP